MPRGLNFEVEAVGVNRAASALAHTGERMVHLEPAWAEVDEIMESGERRLFDRYHGKYVLTGALKESLTGGGSGAIRRHHGDEYEFGTSIFYARFLRRRRASVPGRPPRSNSRSAVLVLQPTERRLIARVLMRHITGRHS